MDEALRQKLETLPQSPGCYIMRDRAGVIMYVGKAVNLRARVRSYFTKADPRAFVQVLDELLGDIEIILVTTEKEALLLENELIKKHQPRFNVMLRDDKNFISLRLDVRQTYPRLEVVRRTRKDGARYFGPYSSASAIRETLRVVNRYFQLRTCSDQCLENRRRPCLQYQIGRCPGPCVFPVAAEDYRRHVEDVTLFLSGKTDELSEHLRARMKTAAKELRFEEAAMLRDQLAALQRSLEKQRTVSAEAVDQDVFGLYREGPLLTLQVLFVRQGRLSGARHWSFKGQEFPDAELLGQFVDQYYDGGRFVPREVLLPVEVENLAATEEWLSERRGERVRVAVPQRGEKLRLVEMARQNAEHNFREWRRGHASNEEVLARLKGKLSLSRLPRRIECYDNSHLQGTLAVGSRVVFVDGEPDKALYRHYKVRTASGDDDFEMMREVLERRLARGAEENDLPDLVVIDGGKGQLNVARAVLKDQGLLGRVDLVSLAKGRVVDDEALFAARQGFAPADFHVEGAAREGGGGTQRPASQVLASESVPAASVPAEPGAKESAGKESAEKESAGKESAEKESAEKESAEKESAEKESAAAESPSADYASASRAEGPGEGAAAPVLELRPTQPAPPRTGRSRNPGRWKKDAVERSPERVFLPGRKNPVVLRANSAELFLLQRLRDEAHRFAITFQRRLRREANFRSVLSEIPGVGDTRKRALLRHFGSLRRIREASAEEIARVEGFHPKVAEEVWRFFHAGPAAEAAVTAAEAEEMALADAGLETDGDLTGREDASTADDTDAGPDGAPDEGGADEGGAAPDEEQRLLVEEIAQELGPVGARTPRARAPGGLTGA